MATEIHVTNAKGPLTSKVSRTDAEAAIKRNPNFPKDATVSLDEVEGRWIAAIAWEKTAEFPPSGGGPADSDEESPGPKSEGPDDKEPSEGIADEAAEEGESVEHEKKEHEQPGGDKDDKGKGGESHELSSILGLLTEIAGALGISPVGPGAGPVPGADGAPAGPPGMGGPPPGPPGHGGPPGGPPKGPPGPPGAGAGPEKVQHEKAPAPPVPTFSHKVNPHPWAQVMGIKRSFTLQERIPEDMKLSAVDAELRELAEGTAYRVRQITEGRNAEGHRIARALISV